MTQIINFTTKHARETIQRILDILAVDHLSNEELAQRLDINPRTVRYYVAHLREDADRRIRVGSLRPNPNGKIKAPIYEALAPGEMGPLLPDVAMPPPTESAARSAAQRQRQREQEAQALLERQANPSGKPRRDPLMDALFGHRLRVAETES